MSAPSLLEIANLAVSYGKVEAVRTVSLAVPAGSIVTVIGANGAGKTTLLNAAMGLLPSTGSVTFDSCDQRGIAVEARVADGLVLVPERRELFATLPVEDNLLLGAFRLGKRGSVTECLDAVYTSYPRLKERRKQVAGTLSGGERQMLALGRALMSKPRLLMLDEPSLGLAPQIVRESMRMVAALKDSGVSVLLVEQNARAALDIADFGYVMELGEIVLKGPAADLARDPRVIESYLGLSAAHRAGPVEHRGTP
ncbi:MAG TPA: ABC transporter ATP-binding protein [Magnetospirillaceae bacterium]|jgi:branched-chain amino acid transport system ATP-binding protein